MFGKTVTVFNYYESATGAIWYPHVLNNVHLETDKGQILKVYGADSADNAILHIPLFALEDGYAVKTDSGYVHYMHPKEWKAQVNDDMQKSITLGSDDFFIVGDWTGSDVVVDADYQDRRSDGFYAYMNNSKDNVYKVSSVSGAYSVLPHLEVSGK